MPDGDRHNQGYLLDIRTQSYVFVHVGSCDALGPNNSNILIEPHD